MKEQWWQEEVVYQIYPKSFYDSNQDGIGDLRGITEKLDYLENLGITMLWICPIYQSPMDDNGYDISDYRAVAKEFGTMEDLEELIGEARKRRIKIMLDLVINHTSDEHEWFQKALADSNSPYHDFYIFREGDREPNNWRSVFGGSVWEKVPGRKEYYFHAFGKKQPDLNWENPKLRERLYEMVNWWLEKGIAGFRIDAITFVKKDLSWKDRHPDGADGLAKCTKAARNQPGIGTFLHELKEHTFDRHECVTVAEAPGVPYDELEEFIGEQGYFSMIFDFRYADLDIASGSEWFKRIDWNIRDLNEKIMASQMALQKYGWCANFIENHDQPRAATKYLREDETDQEAVKTLGAMYFFLRGMPFIYQGQELGMRNFKRESIAEFNDLSSIDQYYRSLEEGYSEEEALEFVNLRSRDNARTPFPWKKEQFGGFSSVKPWLGMSEEYPAINAEEQVGREGSVYEFYRSMISFRQKGPYHHCLIYGNIKPIASNENVIAYQRYTQEETIYCWFNFSREESVEDMPQQEAETIWSSYGEAEIRGAKLVLKPYQSLLLRGRTGGNDNGEE
ncbi:alpha-glucosidase [Faecalicatena sp. AGMB00832]|uniref:Alpha-glucosidase n=1 Tax=Faecalicatena faecalis TaxID=2726362 RepID=A0ABS6D0D0_9FIRM|nr:alpha-glucosidase [Faecalicatena faecalis]MBU3874979.1 alpha-glucosidase [Faecalicatena faecalis]